MLFEGFFSSGLQAWGLGACRCNRGVGRPGARGFLGGEEQTLTTELGSEQMQGQEREVGPRWEPQGRMGWGLGCLFTVSKWALRATPTPSRSVWREGRGQDQGQRQGALRSGALCQAEHLCIGPLESLMRLGWETGRDAEGKCVLPLGPYFSFGAHEASGFLFLW